MEHEWKKATLLLAVAAKFWGVNFMGSPSSQGGKTPKFKEFGNNFYMNWQRTRLFIQ